MIPVKKQGPFEVFSRGVEEPWSIWRDGQPYRQVWTWEEVDEILRGKAKSTSQKKARAHSKINPKEQLVELLMQRTDEARQIARDLLLKHGVLHTGRVDSVRVVGDSFSGPIFQIDVVMHTGGRIGENDPKRFWMAGPVGGHDVPAIGSAIDFTTTDEYPPTGKSAFAPKKQIHPVSGFLSAGLPESVIRKWIAKWWH